MDGVVGVVDRIRQVDFAGIRFGEAAVGGVSAFALSELTEGLLVPRLPTMHVALVKAGETYAMYRWGGKVLGEGGAMVATLFLAYGTLRTAVPMEQWIENVIAKITGAITPVPTGAVEQAPVVVNPGGNGHQLDAMGLLSGFVAQGGE